MAGDFEFFLAFDTVQSFCNHHGAIVIVTLHSCALACVVQAVFVLVGISAFNAQHWFGVLDKNSGIRQINFSTKAGNKQRQWPNIQLLIEHGANINQSNGNDGSYDTAVNWYSGYSNFDKVYWLLQHGADPTLRAHGKFHPPEGSMVIAEDIYWLPAYPEMIPWQRKCQHWLRDHGIKRADKIPLRLRHHREGLGLPTDEKNIPLL